MSVWHARVAAAPDLIESAKLTFAVAAVDDEVAGEPALPLPPPHAAVEASARTEAAVRRGASPGEWCSGVFLYGVGSGGECGHGFVSWFGGRVGEDGGA